MNRIDRHRRQPIAFIPPPNGIRSRLLALDRAGFLRALMECSRHGPVPFRRCEVEEPDHRHRWLLRVRRERPRSRRAAECDQQFPPSLLRDDSIERKEPKA